MMQEIKVWLAVEPNGHRRVSTVSKSKQDCKNLARDLVVRGTRSTAPEWVEMKANGWTVQPYTLQKGHAK